jgi:16S rRNA (cytosine967-C5)-methyltransferase
LVSIQDLGAQRAAEFLDVRDGMRALDACAAPGGKTGHLLETAKLKLTAVDNDPIRLARIDANLHRLNLRAKLVRGDCTQPQAWWDGHRFERILADVPCSASGVVRRHPDIKWLRQKGDIPRFARLQSTMLAALWPLLAPGGKLLFVTCSLFPQENEERIAAFLALRADARRLPIELDVPEHPGSLLPSKDNDGFYFALLEKR